MRLNASVSSSVNASSESADCATSARFSSSRSMPISSPRAATACALVGRSEGTRVVIAASSADQCGDRVSGISGSRMSRAVALSSCVPGNSGVRVKHSSNASPREYTSDAASIGSRMACSGLR